MKTFDQIKLTRKRDGGAPFKIIEHKRPCVDGCAVCAGSGHFGYDVPVGHRLFGKLFACPKLPIESAQYDDFGLKDKERLYTFGDVDLRENIPEANVRKALEAVKQALHDGHGLIMLFGGSGLAKSLLLKIAIADRLRLSRSTGAGNVYKNEAHYCQSSEALDKLRGAFDHPDSSRQLERVRRYYTEIPTLALDELGVGDITPWAQAQLFRIIDQRYNATIENGEPLITLLASNLTPADFEPRLQDRLEDAQCKLIQVSGESYRLTRGKK